MSVMFLGVVSCTTSSASVFFCFEVELSVSFGEKYSNRSLVGMVSSVGSVSSFLEALDGIMVCAGVTSVRTLSL